MRMTDAERVWAEARVIGLVRDLVRDAPVLEIAAARGPGGALVVDCGVGVWGSWEAGRRVAVLSQGGMMEARLGVTNVVGVPLAELSCDSWRPPVSAYGLQVSFALSEVDPAIRVSGPVRAAIDGVVSGAGRREAGPAPWGVAVVESDALPDAEVAQAIARRAGLSEDSLALLVVPARSLAGVTQIAGRLNECVLFTLAESLGLDPECVVGIVGAVPIAPCGEAAGVSQDDLIHYAGRVAVTVDAPASWDLQAVADGLVFRSSPAHGRLFSELLRAAGGVFEAIPGINDLNKVASVMLFDRRSGRTVSAGGVDATIVAAALAAGQAQGGST